MILLGRTIHDIFTIPEPQAAWTMCNYITWLIDSGLAYSSVRTYVTG